MVDLTLTGGVGAAVRRAAALTAFMLLLALSLAPTALALTPIEESAHAVCTKEESTRKEEAEAYKAVEESRAERESAVTEAKEVYELVKGESGSIAADEKKAHAYEELKLDEALEHQALEERELDLAREDESNSRCDSEKVKSDELEESVGEQGSILKLETKLGEAGYSSGKPLYVSSTGGGGGEVSFASAAQSQIDGDTEALETPMWVLVGAIAAGFIVFLFAGEFRSKA